MDPVTTTTTQSRFWCLTINNPVSQIQAIPDGVRYLVSGEEIGEAGTPHLQMYLELKRAQRFAYVKKLYPTAHIEPRMGTGTEAANYCKKGDQPHAEWISDKENGTNWGRNAKFVEFGDAEKVGQTKGKRNDLELICKKITDGASMQEIAEEAPATFVRNYRGLAALRSAIRKPKEFRENLEVWLYIGKTRSGKSYNARITHGGFVKPVGKGLWFDGYDWEKTVILDEFRGQYPLSDMLQILDPYKTKVETKGGHTFLEPEKIIITTNDHPADWYADHSKDSRDAFLARFTKIFWFYGVRDGSKHVELVGDQRRAFLEDRVYPAIPGGQVPAPVVPMVLKDNRVAPQLKRTRSVRDIKEGAVPEAIKPKWHFDNLSKSLVRPFKQPKVVEWRKEPKAEQTSSLDDTIEESEEDICISISSEGSESIEDSDLDHSSDSF